jgi:hypothetical protein
MSPKTITCDGRDYGGVYCGATAILQRIDFRHGAILDEGSTAYRHILREARYKIICPKCGPRVQGEKAEDPVLADVAGE